MSTAPQFQPDVHVRRSGDDYAEAFLQLLPHGQAWPKEYGCTLERATNGLNQAWGSGPDSTLSYLVPDAPTLPPGPNYLNLRDFNVDGRAAQLLEIESDPRYASAPFGMLADWERCWGLPDPCIEEQLSTDQLRGPLLQKMTLLGAQSRQWFVDAAAQLGYEIHIGEYSPYTCGISRCGAVPDDLYPPTLGATLEPAVPAPGLDLTTWTTSNAAVVRVTLGGPHRLDAFDVTDNSGTADGNVQQTWTVVDDSTTHTIVFFVQKDNFAPSAGASIKLNDGTTPVVVNPRLDMSTGVGSNGASVVESDIWWWKVTVLITNNSTGNTQLVVELLPAIGAHHYTGDSAATGTNRFAQVQVDSFGVGPDNVPVLPPPLWYGGGPPPAPGLDLTTWTLSSSGVANTAAVSTIKAGGPLGVDAYDVSDVYEAGYGSITQTWTVPNDAATHTITFFVQKSSFEPSVGASIQLTGGTTAETLTPRLDMSTGIGSGGATVKDMDLWWWEVTVPITNNSTGNTLLTVKLFPAVGAHVYTTDETFVEGTNRFAMVQVDSFGAAPPHIIGPVLPPHIVPPFDPSQVIVMHPRWQLAAPEIRFYWHVYVDQTKLTWFRTGGGYPSSGQCGVDTHLEIGLATDLECLLGRWKPAHTQIIFDYSGTLTGGSMAGTP